MTGIKELTVINKTSEKVKRLNKNRVKKNKKENEKAIKTKKMKFEINPSTEISPYLKRIISQIAK
jgi:molybdopterin/thiamine biosynthesis adenylyltransferase